MMDDDTSSSSTQEEETKPNIRVSSSTNTTSVMTMTTTMSPFGGPFIGMDKLRLHRFPSSTLSEDEYAPSVAESEVSSLGGFDLDDYNGGGNGPAFFPLPAAAAESRLPLQWEFKGLTVWLEYEEYDQDLTRAIDHAVHAYGIDRIPVPHSTAIYGMEHLSEEEAIEKLNEVPRILPRGAWPTMDAPRGVTCDIAQEGRPGQVCTIAWSELTFRTNDGHESALDALYGHFEVPGGRPGGPWTPHISLAYDNPEDPVLKLRDLVDYVIAHPSLMYSRKVKALSLWNTEGKMADWQCLDRVHLT